MSVWENEMKKIITMILFFTLTNLFALNCSQEQHKELKYRLEHFFSAYKVKMIKPKVISYNCYIKKTHSKPWANNVALVLPKIITGLPSFDKKTGCRYWSHKDMGYILCQIKLNSIEPTQ